MSNLTELSTKAHQQKAHQQKATNIKEFFIRSAVVRAHARDVKLAELEAIVWANTCWVCKTHDNDLYDECHCGRAYCRDHDLCTYYNYDSAKEEVACIGCKPDKKRSCNVCKAVWHAGFGEVCPPCSNNKR